jgi:THO complex subunit 2
MDHFTVSMRPALIRFAQLAPDSEGMEQTHKDYLAKVESRIAGAKISQLAMAAPLESVNSASKPKAATPSSLKTPEAKEKSNQKVGIVSALLSIGAIRPALSLITTYPWMVDANPQLADLIIRIMKHSIASLYESTLVTKERPVGFLQSKARYGAAGLQPAPARKPYLTFWAPTPPSTSVWDFVFFFPKWTERVPVCTQLSDLVDFVEPFMRFITIHISRDTLFVTKFLRLGRHHLATTVSSPRDSSYPSTRDVNTDVGKMCACNRYRWTQRRRNPLDPPTPTIRPVSSG